MCKVKLNFIKYRLIPRKRMSAARCNTTNSQIKQKPCKRLIIEISSHKDSLVHKNPASVSLLRLAPKKIHRCTVVYSVLFYDNFGLYIFLILKIDDYKSTNRPNSLFDKYLFYQSQVDSAAHMLTAYQDNSPLPPPRQLPPGQPPLQIPRDNCPPRQ